MVRFGQVIKEARKHLKYSLKQVADKAGTMKGYICMIEAGSVNPPSPKMTEKLAALLHLDRQALIMLGFLEKAPRVIRKQLMEAIDEHTSYLLPLGSGIEQGSKRMDREASLQHQR